MLIKTRTIDRDQIRRDCLAKTQCNHPRMEARKRILTNQSVAICNQCTTCGNHVGQAISRRKLSDQDFENLGEWDHELHPAYIKRSDNFLFTAIEEAEALASAEWHQDYKAYLETAEWKERRARVMRRASNLCEGCLIVKASVVHHLTYAHAGDELMFELVALCDACHRKCHPEEAPLAKQDD